MTSDPSHTRRQVAKGTAWAVSMRFCVRGLGVISTIILARLLVPADFGLVALAMMVAGLLEMMTAIGIEAALISDQKAERAHYDTAWTLRILRGVLIALLLLVSAGPAAGFFDEPALQEIMYWLAFAAFVQGFENIGTVDFLKDLRYDRDFVFLVTKKILTFTVTVTLGIIWQNYWALIAGIVTGKIMGVVLSYMLSAYRPRLSVAAWHDIFGFSKWMLVREFILYVAGRADTFLLGKLANTQTLGFYTVGYEIGCLPTTELGLPITRAMFPGLSKFSSDMSEFRRLLTDSLTLSIIVALPLATGLSIVAEPLVLFALGEKWVSAGPLVEVIALYGLTRIVGANSASAFLALRRPDVLAGIATVMLIARVPLFWWAITEWGVIGLAYAVLGLGVVQVVITLTILKRFSLVSIWDLAKSLWRAFVACALMVGSVELVSYYWLSGLHPGLEVGASVVVGTLSYVVAGYTLWHLSGRPENAEHMVVTFVAEKLADRGPFRRLASRRNQSPD